MKKLICIAATLCILLGLCSCGVLTKVKDKVDNLGNDLGINLNSDKLQSILQEGVGDLEKLFGQNVIEVAGEVANNTVDQLQVYNDKIVITVSTDAARKQMEKESITIDTLQAERADAETAKMDYKLQYQFCVQLSINEQNKAAVGVASVTEDTLNNTLDITIPISAEEMGVTIYELLQGGKISVETCLQHGTATTKVAGQDYFINKLPEGQSGLILTMVDHRDA